VNSYTFSCEKGGGEAVTIMLKILGTIMENSVAWDLCTTAQGFIR
jgi:hypothetical protein